MRYGSVLLFYTTNTTGIISSAYLVLLAWLHQWCTEVSDYFCSSASSYDSDREASGRSRKRKKSSRSRKVLSQQFMHV
jgi:hypothetical protein